MTEPKMHYLIGITGFKRSGKTTVGDFLQAHGFESYALADPIKVIAKDIYNLTEEQVQGLNGYDREQILPEWGVSVRQILQKIGTEMGRNIHEDTWVRKLMRRIEEERPVAVVITDVRFDNEARAIRARGGEVWRIDRPGVELDDDHASKTSILDIEPDFVVRNDGTLDQLEVWVVERLNRLMKLHSNRCNPGSLKAAERAREELVTPEKPSWLGAPKLKTIDAELYREWYEDSEWWRSRYPDGHIEEGPECYDDQDRWCLAGELCVDDLGWIVDPNENRVVDLEDELQAWMEAKGKVNYRTMKVRVHRDKIEAFHKAVQSLLAREAS